MEEDQKIEETEIENDEAEFRDVEILEFSLDEEEIDELILKLNDLKQTKANISFDIDVENELLIHYESDDDSGEENEWVW